MPYTRPPPSARHRLGRTWLLGLRVFALYLALSLLTFASAWSHPTSRLIGASRPDASQHSWFLTWTPYALSHLQNPFYSHQALAPGGINLMWNTAMPLPGLLLAPLTWLFGATVSFNVLVTLGVAGSALAMFGAARRYVRRPSAAVVAGLLYGFGPYMIDQAYAGHSNLVQAYIPPLLLLLLDTILVRQTRSPRHDGLLLGLVLLAQFFITEELLASEALAASLAVVILVLQHRGLVRAHLGHAAASLAWALGLFLPCVAYPLWLQFFGPGAMTATLQGKDFFVTDILQLVVPSAAQGLDPGFAQSLAQHYSGNAGEWTGYLGIPLLLILGFAVRRHRHLALVRFAAWFSLANLVVSLGGSLHIAGQRLLPLPGRLLEHLPLLSNLTPARQALYVGMGSALLVAAAVDRLPPGLASSRRQMMVGGTLVALCLLPPLPFPSQDGTSPAFFTSPAVSPLVGKNILVVPFSQAFASSDAVLWQSAARLRFAMPEGYFIARHPVGEENFGPPPSPLSTALLEIADGRRDARLSPGQRRNFLTDLKAWQVEAVVLGPMEAHHAQAEGMLTALLGSGQESGGVTLWSTVPGA